MVTRKSIGLAALVFSIAAMGATPAKTENRTKPAKRNAVVVFVNLQRLLSESKLFIRLDARVKAVVSAADMKAKDKYEEFAAKKKAFLDEEPQMSPADRERRDRELQVLSKEIEDHQRQVKEILEAKEAEADQVFQKVLDDVLAQLSKELGWDVILSRSFPAVLWNSDAVDQTDLILQKLNERPLPAQGPGPGASGSETPSKEESAPPPSASPSS